MAKNKVFDRSVGAVLRRLRHGDGSPRTPLTQAQVAEAIGLTGPGGPVSISRWESGTVHIPEERLAALAEVFGTTAAAINEEAAALAGQAPDTGQDGLGQTTDALARTVRTAFGGSAAHENYLRRMAIEEEVAHRRERTEALLERLHDAQKELVDGVLKPYFEYASRLDLPTPVPPRERGDTPSASPDARLEATRDVVRWQILSSVGKSGAGAGAAGAGATAVVFAWLAASANLSTRAALLGSLEGAGAGPSVATLAWLGGGPLAAGSIGAAGGSVVMGSIVMLPALIAAGGVLAVQSHRLRHRAVEDSQRLDVAEQELAATGEHLEVAWGVIGQTRTVTDALTTVGLREVRWLGRETEAERHPGDRHPGLDRARFDRLTELVVTATSVLGLPILEDLQPDAVEGPERDQRARWIKFVLDEAAAQARAAQP